MTTIATGGFSNYNESIGFFDSVACSRLPLSAAMEIGSKAFESAWELEKVTLSTVFFNFTIIYNVLDAFLLFQDTSG